ncbi:multicopper oxidase family protein [Roseomonas sp. HF4]|uniref:multicopper oxidase family protein n=1 Tax=Roseomonas sp. HF4 TaxID=2562313 RepID=UPI0010C07949|nr:multicopper oxidase family protein [Roseomonas sp. HF4]
MTSTRRAFLAAGTLLAAAPEGFLRPARAAGTGTLTLTAATRGIEVRGRAATVFGLTQADGTHGIRLPAGGDFDVRLANMTREEVLIHWHGLLPPVAQDGVPGISQPPLKPGETHHYRFPVGTPGTHWMHAHHGLQEQFLMAAPLIVEDPADRLADVQDVVVMLHDFTFRSPEEVLAGLRAGAGPHAQHGAHGGHGGHRPMAMPAHGDVAYDAYLANDRTLDDPLVVRAERGQRVRLRLIGAGTATNFVVDLEGIGGAELVAVDSQSVQPVRVRHLGLAGGQRADVIVVMPREGGARPILFQPEGKAERTGIILATPGAAVVRVSGRAGRAAAGLDLAIERRLVPVRALEERRPDRVLGLNLVEAAGYAWSLDWGNDATAAASLRIGERVEITMVNRTTMSHPMHLHGHHFQVVAVDGRRFNGAVRDTVLVPANGSVTIAFDADNRGEWPLHCHQLYHMAAGMMTTLRYAS